MKKRWLGTIAALGVSLIAGCGATEAGEPIVVSAGEEEITAETPQTTDGAEDAAVSADVQDIIERGVLRVGVKNAVLGFGYEDPLTGEYSGLEISLAQALADKLGVDVEHGFEPEYIPNAINYEGVVQPIVRCGETSAQIIELHLKKI